LFIPLKTNTKPGGSNGSPLQSFFETWVVAAKPQATDIFQSIFKCFVPVDLKKKHETALESHQRVELSKSRLQKFHFQKVARKKISKFESRELLKNW